MKKLLYLLTVVSFMAFMACEETSRQEEKKDEMKEGVEKIGQDVKETAEAAGDYLTGERNKMRDNLEDRKREIDGKMDDLKNDSSEKGRAAKKRLGELRDEINGRLEELRTGTATGWDSTKHDIDTLMKRSDREWTEFKQDFKELFR